MFKFYIENSVIKGYHHFKIRPPMQTPLTVDLEYTNVHDENAALVWIPPLETFPPDMRQSVTDSKRCLLLSDVAGLPIGHVPRGLAGGFRKVIELGGKVTAMAIGEPIPSFPPWPAPEVTGGGVVIPCHYEISVEDEKDLSWITDALDSMPEKEVMNTKLIKDQ